MSKGLDIARNLVVLVSAHGELLGEVDEMVRARRARLQQSRQLSAPLVLDLSKIARLARYAQPSIRKLL